MALRGNTASELPKSVTGFRQFGWGRSQACCRQLLWGRLAAVRARNLRRHRRGRALAQRFGAVRPCPNRWRRRQRLAQRVGAALPCPIRMQPLVPVWRRDAQWSGRGLARRIRTGLRAGIPICPQPHAPALPPLPSGGVRGSSRNLSAPGASAASAQRTAAWFAEAGANGSARSRSPRLACPPVTKLRSATRVAPGAS